MGVSFSLSLIAVEHIFIGDLVSYVLWVLSVHPALPPIQLTSHRCSPVRLVSALLATPALCCGTVFPLLSQTCTL